VHVPLARQKNQELGRATPRAHPLRRREGAANESLIAEMSARGLRKTTKETGLDRKTIRAVLNGKKVKTSTLAKVVMGLREERVAKQR
jgi:hypothetical protein